MSNTVNIDDGRINPTQKFLDAVGILDAEGNLISIGSVLDNYVVSDIDEAGSTKYYGYVNRAGAWYVMEYDTAAGTLRFSAGDESYPANWTGRASLSYDYFYNVF